MTTFLRRFVYLIVDGKKFGTLDLHRINMARFFKPGSPPPIVSVPMVNARLPSPTMTFYASSSEIYTGRMNFMLIGRDKVLATDQMGSAAIYAMCAAPAFSKPKDRPVSVSVGDRLYVLDAFRRENRFEVLVCEGGGGGGGPPTATGIDCLPTPPYRPAHIGASAVVSGSEIWMSTEQALVRSLLQEGQQPSMCLQSCHCCPPAAVGPVARNVWEDLRPPKEWQPFSSYLVHLGSGRFCIARLFWESGEPCDFDGYRPTTVRAVFTAVEVVPYSSKGLQMIKHRSKCYDLGDSLQLWVL